MKKYSITKSICLCLALCAMPFTIGCTPSSNDSNQKEPESAFANTKLTTPEDVYNVVILHLKKNGWQNSSYSCKVSQNENTIQIVISGTSEIQQAVRIALENKNEKAQKWEKTVVNPLKDLLTEIRNTYTDSVEINLLFQCEWDDNPLTLLEISGDTVYDYIDEEKK